MGEPSQPLAADAAPIAWLERVNRLSLVARLVSSTMHDMNNALQVIGGGVELLQMEQADVAGVSRAIGVKTERANLLVQDLSRFVRDMGGAPEPVELRALAEYALALRQFPFARLRATRTLLGEPLTVQAVRRELLQVLLNLLVNAEFALAGVRSPEVRVVVGPWGDGAALSVEDNGPGVPSSCRDGLFERRLLSQTGPIDRLGIGLMVSRTLAERQGGALTYTPREPTGAAFTLTLPGSGR
ncbi:MAG: HAMP domain-containing histidine kinase [Acidobacteria bacterium]|nr:HAMP domain-containing histidine kinase [Acidobacteriota bacterium]